MQIAHTMMIATLAAGFILLPATVRADEPLIPKDMRYIGQGGSLMGLDKEEPVESGKTLTRHEKHMKAPWSLEAFRDEGPAHMVFLDSYLMDTYEVSNKNYGEFVTAKGQPAPAYWDDPRLNKPPGPAPLADQPVTSEASR